MKTKTFKKVLATVAVAISMLLLAGLTLVGCGNKNQEPPINEVTFSEYLSLTGVKAWNTNDDNTADVSGASLVTLSTSANMYNVLTFKVEKDIDLGYFSFKATSANAIKNIIQAQLQFPNQNGADKPLSYTSELTFDNSTESTWRYNQTNKVSLKANETITLTIGIRGNNNDAGTSYTKYTTPLTLNAFKLGN